MELINHRYRIIELVEQESFYYKYIASDLIQKNKKIYLYTINYNNQTKDFIDFCDGYFYENSAIQHDNIIKVYNYGLIDSIDDKPSEEKRFYYTTEYLAEKNIIKENEGFTKNEVLDIYKQISYALDYIHFRGTVFKYLGVETVYIYRKNAEVRVKLLDMISIKKYEMSKKYHSKLSYNSYAPEIHHGIEADQYSDIYSFGALLYYLYTNKEYQYHKLIDYSGSSQVGKQEEWQKGFFDIIKKMTQLDFTERYSCIHHLNRDIEKLYLLETRIEDKRPMERLYFKLPLIGRDTELKKIVSLNQQSGQNLVLIHGTKGIGKTRFIKEIRHRMRCNGYKFFNTTIATEDEDFYKTIGSLLKRILKVTTSNIIDKYSSELVKIIPEIGISKSIVPTRPLSEEKELLKLYDRTSNFIIEAMGNSSAVVAIDDLGQAHHTVAEFFDYFIKIAKMKKAPIIVILAYNEDAIITREMANYIKLWKGMDFAQEIRLGRLTIEETAKMIKHILGWNKEPLSFSTRIMREADGVPAYIEEAIKELFAHKAIAVEYSDAGLGFAWYNHAIDYDHLQWAKSIDESAIKQLDTFSKPTKEILDVVSIFNTAVSLEIISGLLEEEGDYTSNLAVLTQLKILNEKLEDWGYTYGFYSKDLKNYIYNNIDNDRRIKLHSIASKILEALYKREGRENKDELIYHLLKSNQREKAIEYSIAAGDRMSNLRIYTQALVFYQLAYDLLDEESPLMENGIRHKYQLLMKMSRVYHNQGKISETLKYLHQVILLAKTHDPYIIIEAKNTIASIYLNKNELKEAEELTKSVIEEAKAFNHHEGVLKAAYTLSRVYMYSGKYHEMYSISEEYLKYAEEIDRKDYIGIFMNQKGVYYSIRGEGVKGLQCFERSIRFFEESDKLEEATRPINNIGVLLQDLYQDSVKARGYFERSLKISQKYNSIDGIITANNNIADSLMQDNQYKKAIEVLNKNIILSQEYEEKNMSLLGYINLIECYSYTGDYKHAYNYLIKAKEEFKLFPEGGYYRDNFLLSSAIFYMQMGQYKKVRENLDQYFDETSKVDHRSELFIKKTCFYAKYYDGIEVDDSYLLDILNQYKNSTFTRDHRMALQEAVVFFYQKNNIETARTLLKEEEGLVSKYDNRSFNIRRSFLEALINNYGDTTIIENNIIPLLSSYDKELKWNVYKALAEMYMDKQNYYRAASSYFVVLETIQLLLNRIPDEFKETYVMKDGKNKIKEQLILVERAFTKDSVNHSISDNDIDFYDFFNISRFQTLFHHPEFYKLAYEQYKGLFSIKIENSLDLLENLTESSLYNLELLLKLAGKFTLATSGVLLGVSDGGYDALTSFGNKIDIQLIQHYLEKAEKLSKGILIENNTVQTSFEANEGYNDIRGLIVLPIKNKKPVNNITHDQRKFKRKEQEKVIGYLYLETDKIFNNFTPETLEECQKLAPVAAIMLNNYYLRLSSSIDRLTGVYVRKHFEKLLQEEIEVTDETKQTFSIIMCDIDHFKRVNDTYGHQKGDMVLENFGRVILESIRTTDYAGRYGGEEFIVLLPATSKKDAFGVAESIRIAFKEAKLLGEDVNLTTSCGVASYPVDGGSYDSIIERADQALYTAKEQGRNQTVVWEEGIGFVDKRVDKLAGIVTGNIVQDQRNVLVLAEAIETLTTYSSMEEKIYSILGRLIEILEAEEGVLFTIDENMIISTYARRRFEDQWLENYTYNSRLINRVLQTKQGEFFIDWEDISKIDVFTGTPNWKSVIVTPIMNNGMLKGIVYLSVPVKEKEFDYSAYNLAKITSNILGAAIIE